MSTTVGHMCLHDKEKQATFVLMEPEWGIMEYRCVTCGMFLVGKAMQLSVRESDVDEHVYVPTTSTRV